MHTWNRNTYFKNNSQFRGDFDYAYDINVNIRHSTFDFQSSKFERIFQAFFNDFCSINFLNNNFHILCTFIQITKGYSNGLKDYCELTGDYRKKMQRSNKPFLFCLRKSFSLQVPKYIISILHWLNTIYSFLYWSAPLHFLFFFFNLSANIRNFALIANTR